jgi:hypothetical protein
MKRSLRIGARVVLLLVAAMSFGAAGALAADPPVKIVSVTPDPQSQDMTVNSITYDPMSRETVISVTPDCYLVTIYPSYPGGEIVTFMTGVGGADVAASQRSESTYVAVTGGTCGEPITLTVAGLKPGPATLAIGVLLYAEHADFNQLTYQVILR